MSDEIIDLDGGSWQDAYAISEHYARRARAVRDHAGLSHEHWKPWMDAMSAIIEWEGKAADWGQEAFNRWVQSDDHPPLETYTEGTFHE